MPGILNTLQAKTPAVVAKDSKTLGYTFVCHPYTFRVGDREFKPDENGFYQPKTPAEVAEFEHFVAKGFAQKK